MFGMSVRCLQKDYVVVKVDGHGLPSNEGELSMHGLTEQDRLVS